MKVVKNETPKEEAKITNIFWEPYEVFFEEECCDGEIEYIQEEVEGLSEDILDLTDALDCIHSASKMMLDIIIKQDEQIKDLEGEFKFHDTTILVLFIIFLLWNLVLTYNVFF